MPPVPAQRVPRSRAKLATGATALVDLEWLSRSALVLTCDNYAYLLWFADQDAVDRFEVGPDDQA